MKLPQEALKPINYIGIAIFPFVLMAAAMSTDATGSKNLHWAHQVFLLGNVALGPLCFAGALSRKARFLGVVGFACAAAGWAALMLLCDGEFRCGK